MGTGTKMCPSGGPMNNTILRPIYIFPISVFRYMKHRLKFLLGNLVIQIDFGKNPLVLHILLRGILEPFRNQ